MDSGPLPVEGESWPVDKLRDLARRWRRGEAERAIARALGCAASCVRRRVRRYGFARAGTPPRLVYHPPIPAAAIDTIRRVFEDGVPTEAISVEMGVSAIRIWQLAKTRGWRRPEGWDEARRAAARFDPTGEQETWLRARWAENVPLRDLADGLGVSVNTVRRLAQRLALPKRDRKGVLRAAFERDPFIAAKRVRATRIIRLYNAGLRTDEVAALEGRTAEAVASLLGRQRRRGEAVRYGCRPLVISGETKSAIRDGYGLGIGVGTLLHLLDPTEGWTLQRVYRAAKRIGVRHRNANDPLRSCLAPEQLMLEELDGRDPVDRVQAIFRRHPSFTEAAALETLHCYQDALARFPGLIHCRPAHRRPKPTPFLRGPDAEIEAARGTYKFIDQKKARAA